MGGAEGIGEARLRGEPETGKLAEQVLQEPLLAAVQVRDPGHVDPQPIRAVDVAGRSVAAAPARELHQRDAVAARLGGTREECRQRGTRIRERLADAHPLRRRLGVDGGDADAMRPRLDERKREIRRHRGGRGAAHALDRPEREPNGNDASHRTIPEAATKPVQFERI